MSFCPRLRVGSYRICSHIFGIRMRDVRDLAKVFRGYGECRARRVRNNIPGSQKRWGFTFHSREKDEQDQTKKLFGLVREGRGVKFLQLLLFYFFPSLVGNSMEIW